MYLLFYLQHARITVKLRLTRTSTYIIIIIIIVVIIRGFYTLGSFVKLQRYLSSLSTSERRSRDYISGRWQTNVDLTRTVRIYILPPLRKDHFISLFSFV